MPDAPCSSCDRAQGPCPDVVLGTGLLPGPWPGSGQREFLFVHKTACKGSFIQSVTVVVWHGPCSSMLQSPCRLLEPAVERKGLSAFVRGRWASLPAGNKMELLLLFWGGGDAAQPACICPGCNRQHSSPSQQDAGCSGWPAPSLPCVGSNCILLLMSFLLSPRVGKEGSSLSLSACQS